MKTHILETERLFLRPLMVADAEVLWNHVSDPDLSRLMTWKAHKDISETKSFLSSCEKKCREEAGITWGIFWKEKFCGIISLESFEWKRGAVSVQRAELGYWLGKDVRKKGIMTEAAHEVLKYAFQTLGFHKVVVGHFSKNADSKKVIKRLGFRCVGEEKEHYFRDGIWHDHFLYELLLQDFFSNKSS